MSYLARLSFRIYVALIALPLKLSSKWYDLYHRTSDWYKDVQKPKGEKIKNFRSKPTKEGKNGSFSPLAIQFPHPFEEEEFELWLTREDDGSFFDDDPKEVKSFRAEILLSKSIFQLPFFSSHLLRSWKSRAQEVWDSLITSLPRLYSEGSVLLNERVRA